MNVDQFKERLGKYLKLQLEVIVNENRCTMLSLLEKKRDRARLSVHQMFLDAPEEIISAIAHYVQGSRGRSERDILLRTFIQRNLSQADGSHLLDKKTLKPNGQVYQLDQLFASLNEQYFSGQLSLPITWYGRAVRSRSRITFGQYDEQLRLIKIHRMLDDPFVPEFFVSFVIYHEMLHSVVPGFFDHKGLFRIHGSAFKKREKAFQFYQEVVSWEKKFKEYFFSPQSIKRAAHGRS